MTRINLLGIFVLKDKRVRANKCDRDVAIVIPIKP